MNTKSLLALPAALGLVVLSATPASAHVTVTPTETTAGSYTVLTFSVGHGCDGSPTTRIAIKVPEGINSVSATRQPFYDVEKVVVPLDPPVTGSHGEEITERVDQVVYTATTPLPDGQRDTFELSLQLPEDAAGETLAFPAIQTCEKGQTAWTEVAPEGAEEPEHPAPAFTVTEATGDGHGSATSAGASEEAEPTTDSAPETTHPTTVAAGSDEGDDSSDALAIAGLVTGLLGLALGGTAFARTRKPA